MIPKPSGLCLSATGLRGYVLLGSLLYLQKKGALDRIKKISSCSVASIISLLLIIGYDVEDIIMTNFKFGFIEQFLQMSFKEVTKFLGLKDQKDLKDDIISKVVDKLCRICTLKELYMASDIEFYISIHNRKTKLNEIISYKTHPDLSCVDAVLMSSKIPLYYEKDLLISTSVSVYNYGLLTGHVVLKKSIR